MTNLERVIAEMEELRGANVEIFGQPQELPTELNDFTIDTVKILEALKEYECEMTIEEIEYDEDGEEVDVTYNECTNIDEYVDYLDSLYGLEEVKSDNTYNWLAPISNHMNFTIYKGVDDCYYLVAKVHRFGDVRCNYTDEFICQFDREDEMWEALDKEECGTVEIENNGEILEFFYTIRAMSEEMSIVGEDIEDYTYARDNEEELIDYIKEELL